MLKRVHLLRWTSLSSVQRTSLYASFVENLSASHLNPFEQNLSDSSKIKKIRAKDFKKGFTLIEVLIVIGLIALIMTVAIPSAGVALKVNIQNSTRELASTIRSSYDEAVLRGTIHRIVIDLEKNQYWVEVGSKDYLMRTQEQEENERRKRDRFRKKDETDASEPRFTMAQSITKKKETLKPGVKFTDALTSRTKTAQTAGKVYAYIFPHGFVEKLLIHLKDTYDRENTLIVNSVTGKSRVFDRYVKDGGQ